LAVKDAKKTYRQTNKYKEWLGVTKNSQAAKIFPKPFKGIPDNPGKP